MKTPGTAELQGKTCTTSFGGRTYHIPLIDRGTGVLYSQPLFCSKQIGPPTVHCINARDNSSNNGTHIQIWRRVNTLGFKQGSFFVAYRYSYIQIAGQNAAHSWPLIWPIRWRRAYLGWPALNFEKINTSTGLNSGHCITTKGSSTHEASNGVKYWYPTLLGYCSPNRGDADHTMMVWKNNNPDGWRITPIRLDANEHTLAHMSCIFYTPQTDCASGDGIIFTALRTPTWEHWSFPSIRSRR